MTGEGRSAGYRARPRYSANPSPFGAVSAGTRWSGMAAHLRIVRIVLPFRKAGATTDNSNTTRTIVPASPPPGIMHKDRPAMSQTPHPLDELLEEFNDLYTDLAQTFLRTGNEIDEWERRDLDRLNQKRRKLLAYRHRQVAGQSFERNGDTDLTRRRFNEAGHSLRVVERTGPKIVRIDDYKHAKTAS